MTADMCSEKWSRSARVTRVKHSPTIYLYDLTLLRYSSSASSTMFNDFIRQVTYNVMITYLILLCSRLP